MTQTTNQTLKLHCGDNIEYVCEHNTEGGLRVTARIHEDGETVEVPLAHPRVIDHVIDLYECVNALNDTTMEDLQGTASPQKGQDPEAPTMWFLTRTNTGSIRFHDTVDGHSEVWLPDEYEPIDIIDTVLARIEKHKVNYPSYSAPANSIALLNELMVANNDARIEDEMAVYDQE